MAYIIAEPCIGVKDGACVEVCPVDCIATTDQDQMYYINPEECIDCAACETLATEIGEALDDLEKGLGRRHSATNAS